jgi:hypothetical protein
MRPIDSKATSITVAKHLKHKTVHSFFFFPPHGALGTYFYLDDVITKHSAMAQQENEDPKRTTVTRRMRKQMNERNMNVIYYSFIFQPVNPNPDGTRRRHPLSQNVSSKKTVGYSLFFLFHES